MTDQPTSQGNSERGRRRGRPWWQWTLGTCLVLAAAAHYFWSGYEVNPDSVARHTPDPIEISPEFRSAPAIPLEPGALADCNVLLVTLDTTRADRLGCYGNEEIETPTLDRLAREGVIFSQAIAATPTTLPSHTSILTGLYPCHHGSRANGLYRLEDSHVTLSEVLANSGYATGAVISSYVLDSRFGLNQGFDQYDDDLSDCEEPPLYRYKERRANKTADRAIRWLQGAADKPFFLWVHYFDPHAVYEPPSPYAERYEHNPYDGEIAFVDAELGRVIDALDELKLTDKTLVVVVGDHGESLGQHNELTHGFLIYEATLRVPLIMRYGQRLGGVHVSRRVSQVDIVPTILSLLGLDGPGRTDGIDLTVGGPKESRPVFAETLHGLIVYGWAALLTVYDGPHKYIHGPSPGLFDLSGDPHESENLYESDPDQVAALTQTLAGLFGPDLDLANVSRPTEQLSMKDLDKLRALGYAVGMTDIPDPESRPDPEGMMPAMHRVERAIYTTDPSSTTSKKIELLEQVAADYPDFHPAFRFLGDMYRLNGDSAKAAEAYGRCIELWPDPTTLFGFALAKLHQGENEAAGEVLQKIVSKYPDHLPAQYFLGIIAGQAQRYEEAAKHFKYIFDVDHDFEQAGLPSCGIQLVQAYVLAGRGDELPGILRSRLETNPRSANVRAALIAYYASQKEYAHAESVARKGVALMPDDPASNCNLAVFLVGCPDPDIRDPYEGVAIIERLCEETAYKDPELLRTLSTLYALTGRMGEGIAFAEKAMSLATEAGNQTLVRAISDLLTRLKQAKETDTGPILPMFMQRKG